MTPTAQQRAKNYSFQLHEFNEALSPYGTIETHTPPQTTITTDDFRDGEHFRTGPEPDTNHLQLELEDRILSLIVDESGSMTWNDNQADRYTYFKRLLTKLDSTYPGAIRANLIGFGGVPAVANIFTTRSGNFQTNQGQNLEQVNTATGQDFTRFLIDTFGNSSYDFAGVRVVRRTDRYPLHPADGVIVLDGVEEAVLDDSLTDGQQYYYGVWTFNKDHHASRGQFISGVPHDRILPKGVNFIESTPRILWGIQRDEFTQLIYNLQEGSGYYILDSSGTNRHGTVGAATIETSFWAGDAASSSHSGEGVLKKPIGVRFDGQYDIIEVPCDAAISHSSDLTINLWVYRYPSDRQRWVIGTSSTAPSNLVGWAIGFDTDGTVLLAIDEDISAGFSTSTGFVVPEKTWTMLTWTFTAFGGSVSSNFYINGIGAWFSGSLAPGSVQEKLYIGARPVDGTSEWVGGDYFGSLAQISISNTARDTTYITALYNQELQIFDQPLGQADLSPIDNKQREVVLNWIIGEDYNYEGGSVKIVRKYQKLPSHDEDGTVVATIPAAAGEFFYVDSDEFIHNSDYYYRFFTRNSLGNFCDRVEARAIPAHIAKSANEAADPPLEPVSEYTVLEGDSKLMLQWTNPTDERYKGTKIFFSAQSYPNVSVSPSGELNVSNGLLLADTEDAFFIHRNAGVNCDGAHISLENGRAHYYTIVTYDQYGRISAPVNMIAFPTADSPLVFPPAEVDDLYITVMNPSSLSLRWDNPTVKSPTIHLYFGEAALIFVSIRNLYGGGLNDLDDIRLKVCTQIESRGLKSTEQELGAGSGLGEYSDNLNPDRPCESIYVGRGSGGGGSPVGGGFGNPLDENCNSEEEEAETIATYGQVESGLIKGVVTHTNNREILARRNRYIMTVAAQEVITDPLDENNELYKFNTESVTVTFTHPVKITALNKSQRFISVSSQELGYTRSLDQICYCPPKQNQQPENQIFNGIYCKATVPYVCRIELQYKGGSLPDGTPVSVSLWKHDSELSRTLKSDRTFMKEGIYSTSAVTVDELDSQGNPTGRLISKSIVDIEVPAPQLPDWVDLYVTADVMGFFIDVVHEIRFINSLFIRLDASKPEADGIDVAEQFATVWQIDPDDPQNSTIPVDDGTIVKWTLVPKENGKNRPFYSLEELPLISGVYSSTTSGVARNIFFGPIGNLEVHEINLVCEDDEGNPDPQGTCCLAEEYEIHASVIYEEQTAEDAVRMGYECKKPTFRKHRFLMNAAPGQPGSNPHWVTWADGEHLLEFQIAQNPAISDVMGRDCFVYCTEEQLGGQRIPLPLGHLVSITAPGEILWDVVFDEDPYLGTRTPIEYESADPGEVAHIPIRGLVTSFYLRLNKFMGDGYNPRPMECQSGQGGGGGMGGSGEETDPCEWQNICSGSPYCSPTEGRKWENVDVISGSTTLIANNREITLEGGGDYLNGTPPIYAGFKEPLDVRIIEARINGQRVDNLVCDNFSEHTFVVEATFAGLPVPEGTAIELTVSGSNPEFIEFADCVGDPFDNQYCQPVYGGIIYTRNVNDYLINPAGDQRSLAYFTINPLPRDVGFQATINVTCRYDKLGTAEREIKRCIDVANIINTTNPEEPPEPPGEGTPPETEKPVQNSMIVYNTIMDEYEKVADGLVSRLGHFFAASPTTHGDALFVFGGFAVKDENNQSGITPTSEIYLVSSNQWFYTSDMPTARSHGMTVTIGDYIYCIGGVELDENKTLVVSRKIEAFDVITEMWNPLLADMPEDYGVAFGDAQASGDYIYVSCGVTTMVDEKPGIMNDKILRYSISQDEWVTITPSDTALYSRLTPFACLRQQTGGAFSLNQLNTAENSGDVYYYTSWQSGTIKSPEQGEAHDNLYESVFRWPINIPSGSIISSATLSIDGRTSGSGSTNMDIYLMDHDNVGTQDWGVGAGPPLPATLTSTFVSAVLSGVIAHIDVDVASLIQEFIQRPGYTPGNYIGIYCQKTEGGVRIYEIDSDGGASLNINYTSSGAEPAVYVYGGSIPKPNDVIESERAAKTNQLLNQFRSFILTSGYYQQLSPSEQQSYVSAKETEIRNGVIIPAFIYPTTGFKFLPGSEFIGLDGLEMDISDTLDDEWPVMPMPRDNGQCVYIEHQDVAYFLGGSNQNQSMTLNRVEAINFYADNAYDRRRPFNTGRAHFRAAALGDDIYLTGGLTSGHATGWVKINLIQSPDHVEAMGMESCGFLVTLTNDGGEILDQPVRLDVRGRVHIKEVDDILKEFLAERAAVRALGGTDGQIPDAPQAGEQLDIGRLIRAQNSIVDPNSDTFQRNAASRLNEQLYLFPVLYSSNEMMLEAGIGGTTLLPRSEDPLADFQKLAEFIQTVLQNTPDSSDTRFTGDLTREELAALGDILETVKLPPITINSNSVRDLYTVETVITILDDVLYGQSVSQYDLDMQDEIRNRIEELLTPPPEEEPGGGSGGAGGGGSGGGSGGSGGESGGSGGGSGSGCYVLQTAAQPSIPPSNNPPQSGDPNTPGGTGGTHTSGQCKFCQTILPTNPDIDTQLQTTETTFYNYVSWVPQLKLRLIDNTTTISDVLDELNKIDHEVPFGSSQLYDALLYAAQSIGGELFSDVKKVIYIASDNSENLSLSRRSEAIDDVNAVDGDKKTPVVYTVFSTSYPLSLSAMLERAESSDVERITIDTGGQSSTLVASGYIDQILNLTLGSATGGLGYGIYTGRLDLGELSALTAMTTDFYLPLNTQGFIRLRHSEDGFNFTDWTERFEGSRYIDFVDFFAKIIDFEVILTTGFTVDISEEYDTSPTGIPKLRSIIWETSAERDDYIFANGETVLTNAQQVAMAFEGSVPNSSIIELGVASSNSHNWEDFHSQARPVVNEFGRMFMLERDKKDDSIVPAEPLYSDDYILYHSTYGAWDPESEVRIYYTDTDKPEQPEQEMLTGFRLYAREGDVYFDTRQPPQRVFRLTIANPALVRVGMRLRNRLHNESISVEGLGYIYSSNDIRPPALSQVAPTALNVTISPTNPTAGDTIFALYDYRDLNNDPESGTIISWFKNGQQLFEIQNKSSWTNSDLLPSHKLIPDDRLQFLLIPSDGRDYGATLYSPVVTVVARAPGAEDVRIVPYRNGVINDRYDTASAFVVAYSFQVEDTGPEASEHGTIITWYVNGQVFKNNTYSELSPDPYIDPKSIQPDEVIGGVIAHSIGNQIQVEVTPKTVKVSGPKVSSTTITVTNTIPKAQSVLIEPLLPNTQSTLSLSYTIDDTDITAGNQTNKSEHKWYSSSNGTTFSEVRELRNEFHVSPYYLRAGQHWYAIVTPYDGLDLGPAIKSNTVTISA